MADVLTRSHPPGQLSLRSWVAWTTGGEFVGFFVPAAVAAVTVNAEPLVGIPLLLLAGATEGFVLGAAQSRVLHSVLPQLPRLRWAAVTSGAALLAWLIGLAPAATQETWQDWPPAVVALVATAAGVLLLGSIGVAQWSVLRHHVPRAGRWIWITAAAWLAGLAAFMMLATPLWHEGQSTPLIIAIGGLGGLVMATVVAVVTGVGLRALLRRSAA
jgi:hypothetical protein